MPLYQKCIASLRLHGSNDLGHKKRKPALRRLSFIPVMKNPNQSV
jgi:hypothetical protein